MSALLATVAPTLRSAEPLDQLWLPPGAATDRDLPGLRATDTDHHVLRRDDCLRRLDEWINKKYPPPRCGVNSCPECARFKALGLAQAVALTRPDFTMTLSAVGDCFESILEGVGKVVRALRRRFPFKVGWAVECNGQDRLGHAHHLHGACHGTMPDPEVLSEKAQRAGFGWKVEVDPVINAEAWGEYLFTQVRQGDLQHHLAMNGGQLIHTSDHFYRVGGVPVPGGVDAALAEARIRGLR